MPTTRPPRRSSTMIAELRHVSSSEVADLRRWTPQSADFSLDIRLLVGPAGSEGEESFDITVCSPEWIASYARRGGIMDGRHHLIVDSYNWPLIHSYITKR